MCADRETVKEKYESRKTVKELCDSHKMYARDLQRLLDVSDEYLKFHCTSSTNTWMIVVIARIELMHRSKKVDVKISTYHDVKEVEWDRAQKQSRVQRKFIVMGTKMKEEIWSEEKKEYGLRYWMIFEIIPDGEYQCSVKPVDTWRTAFQACNCGSGFKYQHIDEKSEEKDYANLIIRKEDSCMFQINYHIYNDKKGCKEVPVTRKGVPNGHKEYLELQKRMQTLSVKLEKLGAMEYSEFIKMMKSVYSTVTLKRLDSFVF